jgi:hypothetical protein
MLTYEGMMPHAVAVLGDAWRSVRGDNRKAVDGAAAVALPHIIDISEGKRLDLRLEEIRPLLSPFSSSFCHSYQPLAGTYQRLVLIGFAIGRSHLGSGVHPLSP